MATVKTAMVLDTRRKLKNDNTYPVKLRVTFDRKQKYYPTDHSLTENEFKRVMYGVRQTEKEKELNEEVNLYETKARDIIKGLSTFSFHSFEKQYKTNTGAKDTISGAFASYAADLREEGRIGTAVSYESAQSSFNKFAKELKFKDGFRFADITPSLLRKYEAWMLNQGNNMTTIGFYARSLRSVFNTAIEDGLLTNESYPFRKKEKSKGKYEIPSGENIKKALKLDDIAVVYNYEPEAGSIEEKARDYFLWLYLGNGMNVKDMALLKYDNIEGDFLKFVRAKTIRTKRKVEAIRVAYTEDLKSIVEKWGNPRKNGDTYIFPILKDNLTPVEEKFLIHKCMVFINKEMKKISAALGIEADVTTYTARHSFATILKRSGVSAEFISESLGHTTLKTTSAYLASFEDESTKENAAKLTAFKKPNQLKAVPGGA